MEAFSVTEAMVSWLGSMGYEASQDVPRRPTDEFVTVERQGGGVRGLVDHPVMAVQCWAMTPERAEAMANEVRLRAIGEQPPHGIHSVRVNSGPYKFNDEETGRPRWQIAFDVHCQLAI